MKRAIVLTATLAILVLAFAVWAFIPSGALAAVPKLINFQGILKDGSGNPVANGPYSVTFKIYDAAVGGNVLWTESRLVITTSGLFSVLLGAATPVPDSAFQDTTRYLGIKVGADPEMTPRQQLVSVAYGFRISSVDGAAGGTITSKVSIGPGHINTGTDAFVAGANNRARGAYSVVSGGGGATAADSNSALGDYSTIGGGVANTASGFRATVGGGAGDTASNSYATVGGGFFNAASGLFATVGGGNTNKASGHQATVGGGGANTVSGNSATVGGGLGNTASGAVATVGGGNFDSASGIYATVPGGTENVASGSSSFAAGARAKALHNGTFVWSEGTTFSSTGVNQFLISAPGGVGIGTNSPAGRLHVAGGNSIFDGNVGIGTTTPQYKLHVVGENIRVEQNGFPRFSLNSSGAAVDQKKWQNYATTTELNFTALNDAETAETFWLQVARGAGTAITSVTFPNGNVGIGTTAPAALLHVNGTAGNGTGVWSTVSDRRLKTDIRPLQGALETVEALQGVSFRWKDAKKDAEYGRVRGLIAQDVEKVIPEWIKTDPDGYKRLEPIGVDALLIEAIKEQQKQIEELKEKIARLEKTKTQARVE